MDKLGTAQEAIASPDVAPVEMNAFAFFLTEADEANG
jgi:hypothetical protein